MSLVFIAPELNARFDFLSQFLTRHIRFRPAIVRNNPLVSAGAIIDDGEYQIEFVILTTADHECAASFLAEFRSVRTRLFQAMKTCTRRIARGTNPRLERNCTVRRSQLTAA